MKLAPNPLKQALAAGQPQFGMWVGLVDTICAEICAGAGFDWLVIDQEHAPNDVRTVMHQLQTVAAFQTQAVVRPVVGHTHIIKQLLDVGARNLLVPMVESGAQARELVAAVRYPPAGVRGVGSALARAAQWNRITDYLPRANDEICLLLQVESAAGLRNLDDICAEEGVDGVFIGPSDLAASLGHLGNPGHPAVKQAVLDAIRRIRASGKAAGLLVASAEAAVEYVQAGANFVGVGVDTVMLAKATAQLAAAVREQAAATSSSDAGGLGY
ncbi:MAG: 4-hydroxy-2-oxoheptanedioate aldolase [Gammaproteobacteria bacterium]|nr:4-hydroxy-2-oxoheptanedioate aldolase [Halioglobus sp.]MCP5143747.1 4-hydroxy-2-oxoheptanedioate aldolase [Gammaproteobacteria bacterium]